MLILDPENIGLIMRKATILRRTLTKIIIQQPKLLPKAFLHHPHIPIRIIKALILDLAKQTNLLAFGANSLHQLIDISILLQPKGVKGK